MKLPSRAVIAAGLGIVGACALVGSTTFGQQQPQDPALRKTSNPAASTAPAPPPPVPPAVIGTIDIDAVFKGYDKVKFSSEEFKAAALAKQKELVQLGADIKSAMDKMSKLDPKSPDFKKADDEITQMKARHEAMRQQAEKEFTQKEAEALATLYREIQDMTGRVARARNMTYVVKVSTEPVSGGNPDSVVAAMSRTLVYADSRADITKDVVYYLNLAYEKAGGVRPRAAAPAATTGAIPPPTGGVPRGN